METKRCQRCHKLLRIDAQVCSRCGGHDFLQGTQVRNKRAGNSSSKELVTVPSNTLPSLPPSSHRAGHYSGLHPEDQPYQSSFLPAQRPPVLAQPALEVEEVEDLSYTTVPEGSITPAPLAAPRRQVASLSPLPQPGPQRGAAVSQMPRTPISEQDETERDLEAAYLPAPAAVAEEPRPLSTVTRPPARRRRSHLVPILLIASCFLFVAATSILAFLLLSSKPTPALKPKLYAEPAGSLRASDVLVLTGSGFKANALVIITRDTNVPVQVDDGTSLRTFPTGNFQAQITIAESWAAGAHTIYAVDAAGNRASITITVRPPSVEPPLLQLAHTHLDLGAASTGTVSHQVFTLSNAGGEQVIWQGKSDQPWLTLSPSSGTFAGQTSTTITVDRSNLAAGSYSGQISFSQQGSKNQPLKLTVTMAVNPASANLVLSYAAMNFQGTTAQDPAAQSITIQNTGGQALDWTASVSTASGINWLALSYYAGNLAAGSQATIGVSATSAGLSAGSYQGTLTFSYAGASSTPVTVTLTVSPPPPPPLPRLAVQPAGLNFNAILGQNPPAQSFTITNSGNAPMNWSIAEDSNGSTYAPVSQSQGTLPAAKSIVISVAPTITQASAGALNALITVTDTDAGAPVKSQQVKVTITIVNQAVISLSKNQFTFNTTSAIPNSSQLLTVTNTGSAPLNWSISITNTSPVPWLSVDNSGGTLAPGGVDLINVASDSTLLSPGTFTATLAVSDTDAGTPVHAQTITVTLVVS